MVEAIVDLISVLAICATLYFIASHLPSLTIVVKPADVITPEPVLPISDLPEEIMLFCAQESEEFATEGLLREAHELYADLEDWDEVLVELGNRHILPEIS